MTLFYTPDRIVVQKRKPCQFPTLAYAFRTGKWQKYYVSRLPPVRVEGGVWVWGEAVALRHGAVNASFLPQFGIYWVVAVLCRNLGCHTTNTRRMKSERR